MLSKQGLKILCQVGAAGKKFQIILLLWVRHSATAQERRADIGTHTGLAPDKPRDRSASSSRCPWCRTARASGRTCSGARMLNSYSTPLGRGFSSTAPCTPQRANSCSASAARSAPAQSAAQGPVHQNIWQSRQCHRLPPAHSNPFAAVNCAVRSLPVRWDAKLMSLSFLFSRALPGQRAASRC